MEHFEEGPESILGEAYGVITKNGYFLVSVPFINPAKEKAYKGLSSIGNGDFFQYMCGEQEFKNKLEKIGFKVETIYKLNWIKSYKKIQKYKERNNCTSEKYYK